MGKYKSPFIIKKGRVNRIERKMYFRTFMQGIFLLGYKIRGKGNLRRKILG